MRATRAEMQERMDLVRGIKELRELHRELHHWLRVEAPHLVASVISVALVGKGMWGHDDIANRAGEFYKSVGVYFLVKDARVVYVGQSVNVVSRIAQHERDGKDFDRACYIPCSLGELDVVESLYIWALRPALNRHAPIAFDKLVERLASSKFAPVGSSPGVRPEAILGSIQAQIEVTP